MPAVAVSPGVVGGALWWALVERGTATWVRGALTGALTGVVAHPVTWFVFLAPNGFILPQYLDVSAIARGVGVSLFSDFWGFLLAGWLTASLGCVGAVFLVAIRTRDA